jgi:hypothetical protein
MPAGETRPRLDIRIRDRRRARAAGAIELEKPAPQLGVQMWELGALEFGPGSGIPLERSSLVMLAKGVSVGLRQRELQDMAGER